MLTATAIVSILSPSPLKSVPAGPVEPSLARKARLCPEIAMGVVPGTATVVLCTTNEELVSLLELQPASAATRNVKKTGIRIGCIGFLPAGSGQRSLAFDADASNLAILGKSCAS